MKKTEGKAAGRTANKFTGNVLDAEKAARTKAEERKVPASALANHETGWNAQFEVASTASLTDLTRQGRNTGFAQAGTCLIAVVARGCEYAETNIGLANACDAAIHAGVSRQHFCRLFREHIGTTFVRYVTYLRVGRACAALDDPGISIKEAAFSAGFGSISQFNRAFMQEVGVSPSQYRMVAKEVVGRGLVHVRQVKG